MIPVDQVNEIRFEIGFNESLRGLSSLPHLKIVDHLAVDYFVHFDQFLLSVYLIFDFLCFVLYFFSIIDKVLLVN